MITGKELREIESLWCQEYPPDTLLYRATAVAPVISDLATTIRELAGDVIQGIECSLSWAEGARLDGHEVYGDDADSRQEIKRLRELIAGEER